jgi:hypothetical protein
LTCGCRFDNQPVRRIESPVPLFTAFALGFGWLILGDFEMASKTIKTEKKRERKVAARGKKRKAALRTKGSTKSAKALFGDK